MMIKTDTPANITEEVSGLVVAIVHGERGEKMNVIKIESRQRERYGDFFEVWEIITEGETKEDVIDYCLENLVNSKPYRDSDDSPMPESKEFHKLIRHGEKRSGDMAYYFRGYWEIEESSNGYLFTHVSPYAD